MTTYEVKIETIRYVEIAANTPEEALAKSHFAENEDWITHCESSVQVSLVEDDLCTPLMTFQRGEGFLFP